MHDFNHFYSVTLLPPSSYSLTQNSSRSTLSEDLADSRDT
uniref:Uncharacterized protein n=1 Tax=Ectopseudomonas oleovorans TaxID=301 RepID=A0A653B8N0_ECTOL